MQESEHLEKIIRESGSHCHCRLVYVDIVKYSLRARVNQVAVIKSFIHILKNTMIETAIAHKDLLQKAHIDFGADTISLSSGDGAATGFTFDITPSIHLYFACKLNEILSSRNDSINCEIFNEKEWCDCHDCFQLRTGINESRAVLYRDLNENYRVAGEVINNAARIMDLAEPGQILVSESVFEEYRQSHERSEYKFHPRPPVIIKHGISLNFYECTLLESNAEFSESIKPSEGKKEVAEQPSIRPSRTTSNIASHDEVAAPSIHGITIPNLGSLPPILIKVLSELIEVPAGRITLSNPTAGSIDTTISQNFLVSRYPVTQELYYALMKENPSKFRGPLLPIDSISWHQAVKFCNRLSEIAGLPQSMTQRGREYEINLNVCAFRLPTEAEWVHASGGPPEGTAELVANYAWNQTNAGGKTHVVGLKSPNIRGLYDMFGNVQEWCLDWFKPKFSDSRQIDYCNFESGVEKILRGGSWADPTQYIVGNHRFRSVISSVDSRQGFRFIIPIPNSETNSLENYVR